MQTFLPYPSFQRSAQALDMKRLGKQRVECLQILNVFAGVRSGWGNHPITRMWTGHEQWLLLYGIKVCHEWTGRGYRDTCLGKMLKLRQDLPGDSSQPRPPWLGDRAFHRSHQSNLIRKLPERYGPMFPGVDPDLPYIWPV